MYGGLISYIYDIIIHSVTSSYIYIDIYDAIYILFPHPPCIRYFRAGRRGSIYTYIYYVYNPI